MASRRSVSSAAQLPWRYQEDEHGGTIVYGAEMDVFDDGQVKPVWIRSRIGRRPIVAAGNSSGEIAMLQYAGGPTRPAVRLLVAHDAAERASEYTAGRSSFASA
jgi:hypothetical protein